MKFLANENFPIPSMKLLRERGFDITHVAEDCPSEKDEAIMRMAREQGRIIITFDRDYGELVFKHRQPSPAGVIYLRFDPMYPIEAGEVIIDLLLSGMISFLGKFTVISGDGHIRQRPLPI